MKNVVSKGFLGYLFVFLAICVGITAVLLCILMFSPGTSIFGISYLSIDKKIYTEYDLAQFQAVPNIDITTDSYNVYFDNSQETSCIIVKMETKINGLIKSTETKLPSYHYEIKNSTCYITTTEVSPFIRFGNVAKLTICFPKTYNITSKNVTINTNTGSTELAYGKNLHFGFNSLTFNTNKGNLYLDEDFSLSSGNLTINSEIKSKININCNVANLLKVKATESAYLNCVNITGNVDINAKFIEARLKNVSGNIIFSSEGGYINANNIGSFTCNDERTYVSHININQINGTCLIANAEKASINLGLVSGDTQITTKSGNVTINEITGWLRQITTKSGAITVSFNNPFITEKSSIDTTSGKITVNFNNATNVDINQLQKGNIYINLRSNLSTTINYFSNKGVSIPWQPELEKVKANTTFNYGGYGSSEININNKNMMFGYKDNPYKGYIYFDTGFVLA